MSEEAATTLQGLVARIEDIAVPEPVSWMPQTTAWVVLGVALIIGLVAGIFWGVHYWRANRYRREALVELTEIERRLAAGDVAAVTGVPDLLRRVTLRIAPRANVASLTGQAWLDFLDGRVRSPTFAVGVGPRLLDLAYQRPERLALDEGARAELIARARSWIRRHRA